MLAKRPRATDDGLLLPETKRARLPRRPPPPPDVLAVERLDATYYLTAFYGQQLDWMVRRQPSDDVSVCISMPAGEASGRRRRPLLEVTVHGGTRTAFVIARSNLAMAAKIRAALDAAIRCVWVPIRLTAHDGLHSQALWIDASDPTHVRVWHYEPHGGDAMAAGQAACGFQNFYVPETLWSSMRAYLEYVMARAGVTHWTYMPPPHWQPAVFGQSCSDVRGVGAGDAWCAMHTTWFLDVATRTSPPAHVAALVAAQHDGTLRALTLDALRHYSARIRGVASTV